MTSLYGAGIGRVYLLGILVAGWRTEHRILPNFLPEKQIRPKATGPYVRGLVKFPMVTFLALALDDFDVLFSRGFSVEWASLPDHAFAVRVNAYEWSAALPVLVKRASNVSAGDKINRNHYEPTTVF
jgi:hypothetical protein